MRRNTPWFLALGLSALLPLGCSSGSDVPVGVQPVRCSVPGASFCVVSCNLGCSASGCSITDIAQNQPIVIEFSQAIDATSINAGTVSIKTLSGEQPTGRWMVDGATLTFEPDIQIIGGMTSFGFRANETYLLTLPGGPDELQALRSTSGDRVGATLTCTLNVARGIIDLDGKPPLGELLAPAPGSVGVPSAVTIVLEFDEIIDIARFQGATTATSPVRFGVRRTRPLAGGGLECDPNEPLVDLGGSPQAVVNAVDRTTQIILQPAIELPTDACVQVEITEDVQDLSGTPADPRVFTFIAGPRVSSPQQLVETFDTSAMLDTAFSSGTWGNGFALPGAIGGDGYMGDFVPEDGTSTGTPGTFQWSTDSQLIPGTRTLDGQSVLVTDGIFRFSRFEVPDGVTVQFRGSRPAQILVRGEVQIDGTVELNGGGIAVAWNPNMTNGQQGAIGSAMGGRGGAGATQGDGVANQPAFNGRNGEDVRLPAGHAYTARAVGTGGIGSVQYPESGDNADVEYNAGMNVICAQVAAGGGGGGYGAVGSDGTVSMTLEGLGEHGPDGEGGSAFNLLPVPAGVRTLDHFLVGGSGGGGGGSHPFFNSFGIPPVPPVWRSGGGGGGGAGAIALRVGGRVGMTGRIEAIGGVPFRGGNFTFAAPAPGGGGSGGSVVIQAQQLDLQGEIDVSGGLGGRWVQIAIQGIDVLGGNGGPGFIRVELPQPGTPVSALGTTVPPATANNIGEIDANDIDLVVGSQSSYYNTGELFPPVFERYELVVVEDGVSKVYSDDAAWVSPTGFPNVGPAQGSSAVRFFIQGAQVLASTGDVRPGTEGPWRPAATDLNMDGANGFRFVMIFDRNIAQSIAVQQLTLFYVPN
ncbi:MAG: Ig-like domain-containing protein [Planctomycetota bacterium]